MKPLSLNLHKKTGVTRGSAYQMFTGMVNNSDVSNRINTLAVNCFLSICECNDALK